MIRLLLAVKNKGIDIDSIYNAEVVNEESGEDIKKNIPPSNFILNKEKRIKVDSALYRKLDNDQAYADSSSKSPHYILPHNKLSLTISIHKFIK